MNKIFEEEPNNYSGFEVMDHIRVYVNGNEKIAKLISDHEQSIGTEVLAEAFIVNQSCKGAKEWNINGDNV